MRISESLTDDAVLDELGQRLARRRLDLGLTQAELAKEAGVSKRTVERIEAGASAQLSSLIRLLRILELLPGLNTSIPEPRPSPIEVLANQGKQRLRASPRRNRTTSDEEWTWGEDE
jgi:transcriptional regulator with XRE-family HTH domain